jgi:hypothetical protein
MALRKKLGWSEGELMRAESKPCSRLMRQTAALFSFGGALSFWALCRLHYGISLSSFVFTSHLLSFSFLIFVSSCWSEIS